MGARLSRRAKLRTDAARYRSSRARYRLAAHIHRRRRSPAGTLRTILPGYSAPEASLSSIYAPTRQLPKKMRVFIDFLVERFGGPYWDFAE
jgi:hypothetical protein